MARGRRPRPDGCRPRRGGRGLRALRDVDGPRAPRRRARATTRGTSGPSARAATSRRPRRCIPLSARPSPPGRRSDGAISAAPSRRGTSSRRGPARAISPRRSLRRCRSSRAGRSACTSSRRRPSSRRRSATRLGDRATWHATLEDALAACGGRAVVYASELLDAFPVQVLRRSGERVAGALDFFERGSCGGRNGGARRASASGARRRHLQRSLAPVARRPARRNRSCRPLPLPFKEIFLFLFSSLRFSPSPRLRRDHRDALRPPPQRHRARLCAPPAPRRAGALPLGRKGRRHRRRELHGRRRRGGPRRGSRFRRSRRRARSSPGTCGTPPPARRGSPRSRSSSTRAGRERPSRRWSCAGRIGPARRMR